MTRPRPIVRRLALFVPLVLGCVLGCVTEAPDAVEADPPAAELDLVAARNLKAPIRGIITRSGTPPADLSFIDGAVVHLPWRDLETADQRFDGPGWAQIEALRARGLAIRVRILAGVSAPDFVKRLGHAPMSDAEHAIDCSRSGGIAIWNEHDQKGGCSTFFWTAPALAEYDELMVEVARRYEAAPEIREVVDAACMTLYAEPFYRAHRDPGSNRRFHEAGFTLDADLACHERTDWAPVKALADRWKARIGGKLVLQNNGLGEDEGCAAGQTPETSHYCYLASIVGPRGFQTETLERLGGVDGMFAAIDQGIAMGAGFIELPSGFAQAPVDRLEEADVAVTSVRWW